MSEIPQGEQVQAGNSSSTDLSTPRESMFAFAQAVFTARKRDSDPPMRSSMLSEPRSASASQTRPIASLTSSELRSLVASRKMVHFLSSLQPSEYEDVQLLVERTYDLYRAEYERAWRAIVPGPAPESSQQAGVQVSNDDALLLHGFLTAVLDWVPLPQLQSGHLIDDDEDEERTASDQEYEAQQRRVVDQLKAAASPRADQPEDEVTQPSTSQGHGENSTTLLQGRAQAFQKLLDLVRDESETADDLTERLNAVVQISGQPFLLTLDSSVELRYQTKYLHILGKRCVFLLETAYRLRLIVQYSRSQTSARSIFRSRTPLQNWMRMKDTVAEVESPSNSPTDVLSGALHGYQPRSSAPVSKSSTQRPKSSTDDERSTKYDFDILRFHSLFRERLASVNVLSTLGTEMAGSGLTGLPRPRMSPYAVARLERMAPVGDGPANENFWRMVNRGLPNAAGEAGRDGADLVEALQIFQRRRREVFSLRRFVLSFVPISVQTAVYNALVPGVVRIMIASPEVRQLWPQLLMHSGWLLFKICILISVLAARLGIPVPTGQDYPQRRAADDQQNQGQQGQGQGQAQDNSAQMLAKLSTLLGWLALADDVLAFAGLPPLSLFWKLYGVSVGAFAFILWDMERWLNRRLESIRREQRRAQRANNAAGRAPVPGRDADGGPQIQPAQAAADAAEGAQVQLERPDAHRVAELVTPTETADQPSPPPSYPPPVYAPRRISVFARQRRDPGQQLGLVVAASLGPAPLLTYLLERLAYIGLDREDEELGLIPRSRVPDRAILDDSTGLIRAFWRPDRRERSVRGAHRLCAPERQVRLLYADIESEFPTAIHRTGRAPLSLIAHTMVNDGCSHADIFQSLFFETIYRLVMAFTLMIISLVPECEILRRKAMDRRTELWRNARRREVERRIKVEEYERERQDKEAEERQKSQPSST
ncbi:hypothetical protein A4X09_0g236 [Tilletia walkeri]|uniref:Uncharacterized protein n=1 Tax=Tilletia walkeri TaxID=117179 RepID=A0A8X7T7V8_9BASI|nr:hypothetical protein A4X09_0g236 [Tilletia walkeri]